MVQLGGFLSPLFPLGVLRLRKMEKLFNKELAINKVFTKSAKDIPKFLLGSRYNILNKKLSSDMGLVNNANK